MTLMVVGLNHKTAPVAVRERLAFPAQHLAEALGRFQDPAVDELVILSTCNRVELYLQARSGDVGYASCLAFLAAYHDLPVAEFTPSLYQLHDLDAVRHLFQVGAGLDSMVLGEAQVLGQVKAAYRAAQDAGKVGVVLQQLFERTFAVARKVRSATGIGEHAVSVSYAAVELAKKIFESLSQCTAMVLGAGNTSELAVRHFVRQGVGRLLVTNRTPGRAEKLAQMFSAEAIPWTAFPDYLRQTDIVLSSTSAPYPILHKATVQEAMQARKGRPMFFIDLAVPRDVDPAINTLDNVFVYDLDALANVVGANRHERQRAALAAQGLIQREVQRFQQWLATQAATPTIVALRQHAESIRRSELDKTLARLRSLGERERQAIEALTVAIVNKLLHIPTVQLKRSTGAEGGQDCVQLVRHLFALDECVP